MLIISVAFRNVSVQHLFFLRRRPSSLTVWLFRLFSNSDCPLEFLQDFQTTARDLFIDLFRSSIRNILRKNMILFIFYPSIDGIYRILTQFRSNLLSNRSIFRSSKSNNNSTSSDHVVVILVAVCTVVTNRSDPTEGSPRFGTNSAVSSDFFKEAHVVVAVRR